MSLTVAVQMPAEDRAELVRWPRRPSWEAGLARRARIVLLADEGVGTNEIVHRVGVSKPTVIAWKKRYAAGGIGGLADQPKPGRAGRVGGGRGVWAGGSAEAGPAGADRRGRGGTGDTGAAAGQAGRDALVLAAAGRSTGRHLERVGRQDLAQVGLATVAAGGVQGVHRPRVGIST